MMRWRYYQFLRKSHSRGSAWRLAGKYARTRALL